MILRQIVFTQPKITTITQVYEWESIISIIKQQKDDTMDETLNKMDNPRMVKLYKKKEYIFRGYFYAMCVLWVVIGVGK